MTYADYCLQFRQINYYSTEETPGFERHHLTPKAVQIEKYGRVIDDTCILVTREQHIEAHRIFNLEFPLCKSQEVAYRFMTNCGGTLGMHFSEETKQRISSALKGKYVGEKNPFYGQTHSSETKQKMRKPRSEEAKREMKKNHADFAGEKNPFYGQTHSSETCRRISEAHKGLTHSEETLQKMRTNQQLKSQEYKLYKQNGGTLKWNEWCKANKER